MAKFFQLLWANVIFGKLFVLPTLIPHSWTQPSVFDNMLLLSFYPCLKIATEEVCDCGTVDSAVTFHSRGYGSKPRHQLKGTFYLFIFILFKPTKYYFFSKLMGKCNLPPGFELTTTETRCWNKKLPKFSQKWPKSIHSSSLFKKLRLPNSC